MLTVAEYELSYQLSAGAIDVTVGLIRGATVAKAGVNAIGKYACLDKDGELTSDPDKVVKRLPVYTDDKTLETLMAAANAGGGVFKVRSDHSDLLEARAGHAASFHKIGDRVVADLHLSMAYKDRDIVLETATKTPRLIGLSIDMIPSFEIVEGRALMRIEELLAVDIVDGGAITPEGLFFSQTVDKKASIKHSTEKPMPDAPADKKPEPTLADCMSAITSLAATVAKMAAPAAPAPDDKKPEELSAKQLSEKLAKIEADTTAKFDAIHAENVKLKKEQAALGKTGAPVVTADADDNGKLSAQKADEAAAAAAKPKGFSAMVEAKVKESGGKMRRSDAAKAVMASDPAAYRAHLAAKGIIPNATAA